MSNLSRYNRQVIMPEIAEQGQEKLLAARVLMIGAGGLGCPALQYLAAAGVGVIGIADHDRVDLSNLQRQTLYATEDQGKPKAALAKKKLQALNPDITIHSYDEEVTDKNALGLFSGYDVIIDGTDNFSAKFLINDASVKAGKPVVYGAIQGFDGQATIFGTAGGPCYRCLHPKPPEGIVLNCAEAGVVGAVAGIVGTVQAMETVKLIVGGPTLSPLIGKLWLIDVRTMETRIVRIPRRKDCPVCAKPPADIILQSASPVCFTGVAEEIAWRDTTRMEGILMIDVRELPEWEEGHIPDALHLPLSVLQRNPDAFSTPAGKKTCVLYCQRGIRSKRAAELLLAQGYQGILSLKGGYEAWRSEQNAEGS